ncbi:anti-anti-sigma regulatory factor [Actinomadura hallensis]|uniref:Anti-anti-sigma regulatory factor n=1 Tax=Actinomadura hallensis TaxID=337895 RepID=A0A543IDI6_9ACTN|nr:STAS domain-containing protein [Actinomadura hallensis]MDA8369324.1 STAS domain-containing protein [Nocardiopsaceae bacterium]TQM68645.1 anti-anti-sigma regulatory factor [Actinomadura hallensis]HLV72911.1 STAS domain-containing protein [Vulgatibacteraceae bacterium]
MKDTTVPGLSTGTRRGFTVLRMPAQISWQNYAGIREEVSRALSPATGGRGGVILDFGDAVLLDAAGLVLLARAETRARLLGRTLRAVVPEESAHVRRALRLTGLSRLVPVFTDAASAAAEPVPPRAARDVDTAYALDAIRALHPGDAGLTPTPPAPSELMITTTAAGDGDHTVVHLAGVLDEVTVPRLGDTLTRLVEGDRRHLMVRMHDRLGVRSDPLPILLGIRWRVAAEGGCLALPSLPAKLRRVIDREGLGSVFAGCRSIKDRLSTEPI